MKILSLDTETLQRFLQGETGLKSDHAQIDELHRQLRAPVGIAYSDWQWNHAAINGARLYSVRPTPHPVGIKPAKDNFNDKEDGWMEDTERYGQYESYGSPAERSIYDPLKPPKIVTKKRRISNFDPTTTPHGTY